ncbi:MAG TPA: cytochrome c [Thermodesulfovibrionales bacterium]|nr:cytochrome c [Thermodesulfovibrionales bacterium]
MIKAIVTLAILSILFLVVITAVTGTPDGSILFTRERCINCHTFKGKGAAVGPDLTDVTKRRSDEWIRDQIRTPRSHSPNPGMPPHEKLSKRQIKALIKYLKS